MTFHRSFSLSDDEECTSNEQDDFYAKKNKGMFSVESDSGFRGSADWPDESSAYGSEESSRRQSRRNQQQGNDDSSDDEDEQEDDSWWGPSKKGGKKSQMSWRQGVRSQSQRQQQRQGANSQEQSQETEEPVKKTKVLEYNHEICFSVEAVKMCPEGSSPVENQSSAYGTDEEEQQPQQQQRNGKSVPFICLERSSSEARRLQRQARRGVIVDTSGHQPRFVQQVKPATACIRY